MSLPQADGFCVAASAYQSPLALADYIIIVGYLLVMLLLGGYVSTRIKNFKDYFLAGGSLTTPLLVCTLVSSYYGIDVTFGTSETSYYYGVAAWIWYSLPYYGFIAFAALVVAPQLARYDDAMTLSDILERHYGKSTRIVGAVACFIYSAPVLAMGGMMTLMQHLGLPVGWGMAATISVCAIYTMVGGLWADALSDTVQFVLMCVSLSIAIPLALDWMGGWSFLDDLPTAGAGETSEHLLHHGGLSIWMLVAWAITGLTVLIEPAFYQRVFAAQDKRSVQRALLIGILLWASYDWGVTLVGMMAKAAVEQGLLPAGLEGREALLELCAAVLPVGLRGLMIGGILAAAMSTIDSYSLLASGNLVYDIYRPLVDLRATDRRLVLLTRLGVLLVMILACAMSLMFVRMRDAWQFMASIMASVLFVPVMGALFARPRRQAGLAAAVAGFAAIIAFYVMIHRYGHYVDEHETTVWQIGRVELWQDFAALCSLPVSLAGYFVGNAWGKRCSP